MIGENLELILTIGMITITIVALFLQSRSVPVGKLNELVEKLGDASKRTSTTVDDQLVQLLSVLIGMYAKQPALPAVTPTPEVTEPFTGTPPQIALNPNSDLAHEASQIATFGDDKRIFEYPSRYKPFVQLGSQANTAPNVHWSDAHDGYKFELSERDGMFGFQTEDMTLHAGRYVVRVQHFADIRVPDETTIAENINAFCHVTTPEGKEALPEQEITNGQNVTSWYFLLPETTTVSVTVGVNVIWAALKDFSSVTFQRISVQRVAS